jgi:16S rRNA (cytosine967-C5)-methyltransferase
MVTAWGEAEAEAFFVASLEDAPVYVRASSGKEPPSAEPVAGIPGAYRVVAASVGELPVQDPSSVAVGLAVEAMPGARVVDLAAAPGGKTLHLLDQVGPEGTVVALDVHQRRLLSARRRASQAHWVLADSRLPPLQEESFDRVLLDAPCSGLGTLRRRPEIRHRVSDEEVVRLASLQSELIAAALPLVGPGGKLVYSVCTVTPEETVEVVGAYNARPPEGLPGRVWGKGWLLGPHLTGTDGMFVSELSPGDIGR